MVTAYYIMEMVKNKKTVSTEEYYHGLLKESISAYNKSLSCIVCLRDGVFSIFDVEINIRKALKIFGCIEVHEDDERPKHLCNVCYKFLKSAFLFRKVARRTNNSLNQQIESESEHYQNDYLHTTEEVNSIENTARDFCFKRFKDVKENDAKIECNSCKKKISKSYYKEHITMHNSDHYNQYVCDICGKSFRLRVGYYKHRLRHRTDYFYKCHLCPFKGRYDESLKSHMRTHIGDYRYMCTECPAKFLFKGNLNRHVLVKHKEPQYKCDSCDKKFHTKLMCQRHHEVEHLGIKGHICDLCGCAFAYRNAMMKHQRRVHKREKLKLRFNKSNYVTCSNN